jgi:anhydro-N-acetylmuramic acid kinase|tara:strand:+ start:2234 stop:3334 length:1101 start_codon:yes stop_codon:yes gene_type:complete
MQGKAMNNNKPIWAAGLMSGTSIDGVDVACVKTDGDELFELGDSTYLAYSAAQQELLRSGLGKWPDEPGLAPIGDLLIETHCQALEWVSRFELVGFHGQTLAHDPNEGRTHQIGDGNELARRVGKPVIWDFRSSDVAAGGQGAPLVPIYHRAMVRFIKISKPVVILNLGGVGNLTWVDPVKPPEDGLIAFDTGPANAPLNDCLMDRIGQSFDRDGLIASEGNIENDIVKTFLNNPYFSKRPPKSLDRGNFAQLNDMVSNLNTADAAATLTAIIVASVHQALKLLPSFPTQVWVTGGGRKNLELMRQLKIKVPADIVKIDQIGFDGDMVEAQAFAYLAVRSMRGLPITFPKTTGVPAPMLGGVRSIS